MSQLEMEQLIDQHENDPVRQQGLRAVAATRVSTPTAERERAHFLRPFASFLDPNPRTMKRLINAYGIHQAVSFLEGRRSIDAGALALWTIIEMRWPTLADWLAGDPQRLSLINRESTTVDTIPVHLRSLFDNSDLRRVIDGDGLKPRTSLDTETISLIVGGSDTKHNTGAR